MSVPSPVDPNPRIAEPVAQALALYPIDVHAGSGAVAAYRHDHVERLVTSGPAGGGPDSGVVTLTCPGGEAWPTLSTPTTEYKYVVVACLPVSV